jgi:hypothetical protein
MIVAVSLAAIALWGAAATVVVTARDGYRQVPTAPMAR